MTDNASPNLISRVGRLIYVHPRARDTSHVNAVADMVSERIAITKAPFQFLSLLARFRRRNAYVVAGNLDLVATAALYIFAPLPGRFILLVSDHRTNLFHAAIVNFFTRAKKARIAFITEEVRTTLAEKLGAHILTAGSVVYHSSKTADLAMNTEQKLPWAAREVDVLFFGRLNEERGLPEFLEIVRRRPDLRFAVAGSGPLAGSVKQADRRLENLRFLGFVSDSAAKLDLLAGSRILFSNMMGVENFGISILEAVASGTAVSCPRDYGPVAILGANSPYLRSPNLTTAEKIAHLDALLATGPTPHNIARFHSRELRRLWFDLLMRDDGAERHSAKSPCPSDTCTASDTRKDTDPKR